MIDLSPWRANRKDLWVLLLFVVLITWTFRGVIDGTKDPFVSSLRKFAPWSKTLTLKDATRPESFANDPTTQSYPWAVYAHENLSHGHFPLWNTRMFSGTPFVANRLTGLFDPLILIPIRLLSPKAGLAVFYFVHYLLAAWFMYLFLKCLGLSRPAATFGAIAYIFQGAYIPWMGFIVADKAYFPAILYYLQRSLDRKDKVGIIGFILSFALLAITSYPQMAVFAVYIVIAWVLFTRGPGVGPAMKRLIALAIMLVLAFLIGAMQHVPTVEFYSHSLRAQPEFEAELQSETNLEKFDSPGSLVAIAFPRIFGDYISNPANILPEEVLRIYNHAYIGILAAFCFLLFWIVRKNRHAKFFTAMSILGLLFLSWNSFYWLIARIIPGFRISTVKPDFLTLTAMIIVASFVIDALFRGLKVNELLTKRFVRVYGWILGAVLGMAIVTILARTAPGFFSSDDFFRYITVFEGVIVLWLAGAILYLYVSRGLNFKWVVGGIIVLELIDLVPYHEHFMPLVDKNRTAFETPSIRALADSMKKEGPFRIFCDRRTTLTPNTPMLYDLDEPGGFDSFVSSDYAHFFRSVDPGMNVNSRTLDLPSKGATYHQPFWDFLGIRYLVFPNANDDLPPPWQFAGAQDLYIYENPKWLPRLFLTSRIVPVDTVEEGYAASQTIEPSVEAVVVGIEHADIPGSLLESNLSVSPGTVNVTSYQADEVEADVECGQDCYLVFSDTYFPGWKAWVDNKPVKIYRTDGIIKGIVVPAGKHNVRFEYSPESYNVGWLMALVGLIVTPFMIGPIKKLNG